MPYLNQGVKSSLDEGRKPQSGAELNYIISKAVNDFLAMRTITYSVLAEAVAALELSQYELKSRIVRPYEDKKVIENGEVFTCIPL